MDFVTSTIEVLFLPPTYSIWRCQHLVRCKNRISIKNDKSVKCLQDGEQIIPSQSTKPFSENTTPLVSSTSKDSDLFDIIRKWVLEIIYKTKKIFVNLFRCHHFQILLRSYRWFWKNSIFPNNPYIEIWEATAEFSKCHFTTTTTKKVTSWGNCFTMGSK